MNKIIWIFCILFSLISCGKKNNHYDIQEKTIIIKEYTKDSTFTIVYGVYNGDYYTDSLNVNRLICKEDSVIMDCSLANIIGKELIRKCIQSNKTSIDEFVEESRMWRNNH